MNADGARPPQQPFRLPSRLRGVGASQIRENMRIAAAAGAINLAQGRPDFATHPDVAQAAIDAIAAGENQYSNTWGLAPLREALAAMLERRFALAADPETEITVTCGVTEALVATMLALVEPGDEVVVIEPAHENYVPAVRFAGGVPRFVTLEPPAFALDGATLEAVVSDRTRAVILNTPHNPSGRVFTRSEIATVLAAADRVGAYVVTDEIYDHLVFTPHEHVAPTTLAADRDRIVVTGGLSKIYAATGWRLGFVVAPPEVSSAIRNVHDYLTICAPTPFQHAAIVALDLPASFYDGLRRKLTGLRDRLLGFLERAGFTPHPPEGAYYLLAGFESWGFDGDAAAFTGMLIDEAGVALVPGEAFYLSGAAVGRGLVRFAFARDEAVIDSVGARLAHGYENRATPGSGRSPRPGRS